MAKTNSKTGRKCGVLLPIFSLSSEYGIGTFSKEAYEFVDFLKEAGQSYWQILPLGPTSYGDSPYQSFSTFAGNPYFIDITTLIEQGLLTKKDADKCDFGGSEEYIDYEKMYKSRFVLLKKAYENMDKAKNADKLKKDFEAFKKKRDNDWLADYSLFMALKNDYDGRAWNTWEENIRLRKPAAMKQAKEKYAKEIDFYCFLQFLFAEQWLALKKYANDNGIEIIGDIPIYCALDSVEAWADHKLFWFDRKHRPVCVAGCPPDVFSPTGQLWGNPLYDWDYHKKTGYKWWIERIRNASELYDVVRIDHFRGFESYYTIPYGNEDATVGEWKKGPDYELFQIAEKELGRLNIIAEDLGFLTPEVGAMLKKCGYPGMKVLQFGFSDGENDYLPHNFTTPNCYAYTGTHDNETLNGWVGTLDKKSLKFAKKYLNVCKKSEIPMAVVRAAWGSIAEVAVAQMQDFLDSPKEDRMNTPSTLGINWQFRTKESDFTPELAKKIHKLNKLYNR